MELLIDRVRVYAACTLITLCFMFLTNCAQPPHQPVSELESVQIAQTSVKNQARIGFCWAYATIGLIESNYKAKTGQTIDLSEEALGYARMKEEMLQMAHAVRAGRMSLQSAMNATQGDGLEGWYMRLSDGSRTRDSMELIDDVGVVPEAAWSVKFTDAETVTALKTAILGPFHRLLSSTDPITPAAIDQVLTSPGAFTSKPPVTVQINGQAISSKSLAATVLQFKSQDYVALQASSATDGLELIGILKKTMQAGYSVPISFGVSFANLQGSFFKATNFSISQLETSPSLATSNIRVTGGHAVLGTDFVNQGGTEGAISDEDLSTEVLKSAEELDYVKFKNSWGAHPTFNERGEPVHSDDNGYYKMNLGYIKLLSVLGRFGIVVPRELAH